MLHSDLRYDFVRTWFRQLNAISFEEIEQVYQSLIEQGTKALKDSGIHPASVAISYAADMRYVGQEHPVTVDLAPKVFRRRDRTSIKRQFDDVHRRRYGTSAPEERAEIVSLRATVAGIMKKPTFERLSRGGRAVARSAERGRRLVYFAELAKTVATPTYARDELRAGNCIRGPALVEEHASTTVVLPGDRLQVDELGNLVIEISRRSR
jgi:N-methylhydantoinase A